MKFIKMLFTVLMATTLFGCAPSNVRVQTYEKQFASTQKTNLVAGLKKIVDKRPEEEREKDKYYEKPTSITVNEHVYKSLKLSGMFENVLFENFDNDKVDVVLTPYLNNFFYETQANGKTAGAVVISLIPFVGLIYNLAGGPSGDHYADLNIELKMTTVAGVELASGSANKEFSLSSNLHNQKTDGIGMLEGRALGEGTYDLLSSFASNIDSNKLPVSKNTKIGNCGSDKDCKGDRICVGGTCINPDVPKKVTGAKLQVN